MRVFRPVDLGDIVELRERVLTPGYPDRPVVWWYDETANHFGVFDDARMIGCVSLTPQAMPNRRAVHPFHLHSMAVEPGTQGKGTGRWMLRELARVARQSEGNLIWATARPSAVEFYRRCGYQVGMTFMIEPTRALMRYVWLDEAGIVASTAEVGG